ncbi:MAG: hypothetical protein WBX95_16425 [Xanthobacteraceae bacterium]
MTVTVYQQTASGIALETDAPTAVVRLRLPNTGSFLVLGRIVVENSGTLIEGITAELTTLDGATVLDTVSLGVGPAASGSANSCITLQGTLNVSGPNQL